MLNKNFRCTWLPEKDLTLIVSSFDNSIIELNSDAGEVFYSLSQDESLIKDLKNDYYDFYLECIENNWIVNDELNLATTKIRDSEHLKKLQIEITTTCNLSCSYCYSTSGPKNLKSIKYEDIISILDEAYSLGCIWVDITGGEPLVHKNWKNVISYAREIGLIVSLHTNGSLLKEEDVIFLKKNHVFNVQMSLDSHIPEIHDESRGKKGSFEKTINAINLCKKYGITVKVVTVAHKLNKDSYIDSVNFINDTLGCVVVLDRVIKTGRELINSVGITNKEFFDIIKNIRSRDVTVNKDDDLGKSLEDFEPFCGVAYSFLYITSDYEVALCPTMTTRDHKLFNINKKYLKGNLSTLWNEDPSIVNHRRVNCENISRCPTASKCRGGCRSNALLESGRIDSNDEISCNIMKNNSDEFINYSSKYKVVFND